jgi:hypothetical protein
MISRVCRTYQNGDDLGFFFHIPEPSFDTPKSAQKQKNAHFQKSATKAQKVLIWLFHFVGHPHMFKQPDPQVFLQHTLTQSRYAWDHAT